MENQLLFIHVENLKGFNPFSLNLSYNYFIDFDKTNQLTINGVNNKFSKIFGETILDINIIGGENGVGKTTILKFLAEIISSPFDYDIIDSYKYLLVYLTEKNEILIHNNLTEKNINVISDFKHKKIDLTDSYSSHDFNKGIIYYSPFLDFNLLNIANRSAEISVIDISQTQIILEDLEDNSDYQIILNDLYFHKIKNIRRQIEFIKSNGVNIPFNIPDKIDIRFNRLKINTDDIPVLGKQIFDKLQSDCAKQLREYPENGISKIEKAKVLFLRNLLTLYFLSVNTDESQSALRGDYPKELIDRINSFQSNNCEELISILLSFFKNEGHFQHPIYYKIIGIVFSALESKKREVIFDSINNELFLKLDINSAYIDEILSIFSAKENESDYHKFTSPNIQKFIFFDWSNFSSGEKSFLDIFSRLELAKKKLNNVKNILLLIDEGEIGFHPTWQIKYLGYLRDFLNKSFLNHQIQLLIATHSPLVLSDLPKDNVHLFKRMGIESGYKSEKVETLGTLGQNVSVLLATDFFIDKTLIGNLAREYIDDILIHINQNAEVNHSETIKRINLIDEPIIKRLLLNELNKKFNA